MCLFPPNQPFSQAPILVPFLFPRTRGRDHLHQETHPKSNKQRIMPFLNRTNFSLLVFALSPHPNNKHRTASPVSPNEPEERKALTDTSLTVWNHFPHRVAASCNTNKKLFVVRLRKMSKDTRHTVFCHSACRLFSVSVPFGVWCLGCYLFRSIFKT